MNSSQKKSKKKSGSEPFDYKALLPNDLDEKTKAVVEKFLRNEDITPEESSAALDKFLRAAMLEQQKLTEKSELIVEELDKESKVVEKSISGDCDPSPDGLSEERQRINVGWMAGPSDARDEVDRKIAAYSQRLGCQLYNFISYPIGGVKRGFWTFEKSANPPVIDLPDLQLQNHLWETYVNGVVSEWIDCDSPDEELSTLSELEIVKELNYAAYMGLRSVVVLLRRSDSPRLAAVINKWNWTRNVTMAIWVFVPTSITDLIRSETDTRDCWTVWADFRTLCSNFYSSRLIAGLHTKCDIDEEFCDPKLLARWKAEPLAAFWVDSDVFGVDPSTSKAVLPEVYRNLLRFLWMSENSRVVVRGARDSESPANLRLEYSKAVRASLREVSTQPKGEGLLADGIIDYMDVLQAPLQPLSDNLDSNVYNTFEQDPIKYERYREAVEMCLKDLGEAAARPDELILYVLGAGRGPLVTSSFTAERNYNDRYRSRHDRLKLKVFVVEKNANAIVTLRYMNERAWKNRCKIVESDMRSLPEVAKQLGLPQPDIIVSELLGSFGDNELSPECLDGVTSFLKPTTISIPQTYTSYAAPIMSLHMHNNIRACGASYWNKGIPGHGREGSKQVEDGTYRMDYTQGLHQANLDQVYVVFLRQFCSLAETKPVFTFDHPNFTDATNERTARIEFDIDRPSDIMGFAGYFHMNLYKDVTLSIVPNTYSKGMISWFPALIPLRNLRRVNDGDKITFVIHRKVDDKGVWYEWQIEHKDAAGASTTTPLQNHNGESYYMKLLHG